MSTYPEQRKAAPVDVAKQITGTARDRALGKGRVWLESIAAAALAVAIVALPAVTNLLANALIGPEPF